MKDIKQKASELLKKCSAVVVSSVNDNGYPRSCVVSILHEEDFSVLYFSTGTISTKVKHFKTNPKASVCYFNGGDSVTLIGNISIVEDMNIKKGIWQDWLINHFPEGVTDPNYCVLRFTANEATIWIENEFKTISC